MHNATQYAVIQLTLSVGRGSSSPHQIQRVAPTRLDFSSSFPFLTEFLLPAHQRSIEIASCSCLIVILQVKNSPQWPTSPLSLPSPDRLHLSD